MKGLQILNQVASLVKDGPLKRLQKGEKSEVKPDVRGAVRNNIRANGKPKAVQSARPISKYRPK